MSIAMLSGGRLARLNGKELILGSYTFGHDKGKPLSLCESESHEQRICRMKIKSRHP